MERPSSDWIQQMNRYADERIPFLFILDFDLLQPLVLTAQEVMRRGLRFQLGAHHEGLDTVHKQFVLQKFPLAFAQYKAGFDRVMAAIQAGDTYLLNFCQSTPISGIGDLGEVYDAAHAPFKLLYPEKFIVFSPEQFVAVKDGEISTFPMKGTIDAAIPNAEAILLQDIKEQEEHATVVDLLRNDLSIVADAVTVAQYRYITMIQSAEKKLLQCSSAIKGKLMSQYVQRPGDLMAALLPAGSVSGAPKRRTVELIHAIEDNPRGYYTGVFGWYENGNLNSAVMIRMIEQKEEAFFYRSGGGITYRSEAQMEYQEMIDKIYVPVS